MAVRFAGGALLATLALASDEARIRIRRDDSEAVAVLAITARREAGEAIREEDWARLFATQPYRRLARREEAMNRAFTDDEFREFVLSDDLAQRAAALRATLEAWGARDLEAAARRVLPWLPAEARIHASVYPVIKPRTNSFVFEPTGDAAIFLYLDPNQSAEKFENTVAHELHHIGFASIAGPPDADLEGLTANARKAADWMSAFGEGFAMLAAAGDSDVHPHAASEPEERARWDRSMADLDADLKRLESFFLAVIDGRLAGDEAIRKEAFSFFGEQGPWYTVGYRMAVAVERRHGRAALIRCMEDPRRILALYNEAASESDARWSTRLIEAVSVGTKPLEAR